MSPSISRIAVLGASGRMGRAVIQAASSHVAARVGAAIERPGYPDAGQDAGQLAGLPANGVKVVTGIEAALADFDVLIDFTRPEATLAALPLCVAHGKAMVIGTTGITAEQQAQIEAAAQKIAIVKAGNFSIGVNLCLSLLEQAARVLAADYDIEVIEAHHRLKRDAPSGTALALGRAAAEGRGVSIDAVGSTRRDGQARQGSEIGFAVVRAGDIVGEHSVLFAGMGESLTLSHRATDRAIFARGALQAAAWLAAQPPGRYFMRDLVAYKSGS